MANVKNHPWKEISLDTYEAHMSLSSVQQLQKMNHIMKEQFAAYPVTTAAVLGIAGGNGLEHADTEKYRCIYGVDINDKYLQAVRQRYGGLGETLQLLLLDLATEYDRLPQADLVIANLLIEYIGYPFFQKCVQQMKPKYVSCVLQVNEGTNSWVSESPYLHAFDGLNQIHHKTGKTETDAAMMEIGYDRIYCETTALPNGKGLLRLDYQKQFT